MRLPEQRERPCAVGAGLDRVLAASTLEMKRRVFAVRLVCSDAGILLPLKVGTHFVSRDFGVVALQQFVGFHDPMAVGNNFGCVRAAAIWVKLPHQFLICTLDILSSCAWLEAELETGRLLRARSAFSSKQVIANVELEWCSRLKGLLPSNNAIRRRHVRGT